MDCWVLTVNEMYAVSWRVNSKVAKAMTSFNSNTTTTMTSQQLNSLHTWLY